MLDIQHSPDIHSLAGMSQIEQELLYSKYQTIRALKAYFLESGTEAYAAEVGVPLDFALDLLTQMALHKRASPETMIGLLRKHFEHEEKPAQACADMIHHAVDVDLCNYDHISGFLVMEYPVPDELQRMIDQFQYPLPMIHEPLKVTNNRQTGYHTIKRSIILKNNHHDDDVCLDHINRMNAQKLKVNPDVVAFVQNSWENLDKKKEDESDEEFEERVAAFEKYDSTSKEILFGLMTMNDGFWLTHSYDKRGRTYAQGYHVNYQGNDWCKAVVEFGDAEPLKE